MQLDNAKLLVRQAFLSGRMTHAYLINASPRGAGSELALYIMQLLACQQETENAPCGNCDHCNQVTARTWCNNLWIQPVKKSRVISIGQMRKTEGMAIDPPYLLTWLGETAFAGGWKVGVIVAADRMNEAAANAFLKMLEEPPHNTLILLLTDAPQMLLPTIKSRCQQIDLDEPPAELNEPWRSQLLTILTERGGSGPIRALATGDRLCQLLQAMKDRAKELVAADKEESESEAEEGGDVKDALVSARYRELRLLMILSLQRWYRDLLTLTAGAPESVVHYQSHLETLRARAANLTLAQALANIEHTENIARQLERSLSERQVFAYWLDRISDGVAG